MPNSGRPDIRPAKPPPDTRKAKDRTPWPSSGPSRFLKPDATRHNLTGKINARLEEAGLRIVAQKRLRLSRAEAEGFYAVHKERPFFNDLCAFMTSGPVVVQVLEGENAVARNREVMGATDPKKAAQGTIRADFAELIEANSLHGSDSAENAPHRDCLFLLGHRDHGIGRARRELPTPASSSFEARLRLAPQDEDPGEPTRSTLTEAA